MKNIKIRKAKKEEKEIALELLKEAALWLNKIDVDYWQHWINPTEDFLLWLNDGFDKGQIYYASLNSEIVGMFRLQWSDEMFWGKQEDNAGYIHSLTVRRKFYNQGIGQKILNIIEDICRDNGKKYLRLDCGENITKLCEYYEKNGFHKKGFVELFGERLKLQEKEL